jgi:hypothetical protein
VLPNFSYVMPSLDCSVMEMYRPLDYFKLFAWFHLNVFPHLLTPVDINVHFESLFASSILFILP